MHNLSCQSLGLDHQGSINEADAGFSNTPNEIYKAKNDLVAQEESTISAIPSSVYGSRVQLPAPKKVAESLQINGNYLFLAVLISLNYRSL